MRWFSAFALIGNACDVFAMLSIYFWRVSLGGGVKWMTLRFWVFGASGRQNRNGSVGGCVDFGFCAGG